MVDFANETKFLKAFEVVLKSDMQVYLISTAIANIAVFIIIAGIVYFLCVKNAIHKALRRAIIKEMENSKSSSHHHDHDNKEDSREDAQYHMTSTPVTLTVKDFMKII
jgi:large-conductance mechanosensitive channel